MSEPPASGYYDDAVIAVVAQQVRQLGIDTHVLQSRIASGPDDVPRLVSLAMGQVDHTLFLSRLGDQIRFDEADATGTRTIAYTRDFETLGSVFGTAPWSLFKAVHDQLVSQILSSRSYHISCGLGTDLRGDVPSAADANAVADFLVTCFPMVIYPPLRCENVRGVLVFDRFLMSTSVESFENSMLALNKPVIAHIEDSSIVKLEGPAELVASVEEQYYRVGAFSGGDVYALNSWHTGIYPQTFSVDSVSAYIQRWGEFVFASPRYTHFHTCSRAPGNIASATFDATITFDGEIYRNAGAPVFLQPQQMQDLLRNYPGAESAFQMRWDIGL